jgi:hypothetical protein
VLPEISKNNSPERTIGDLCRDLLLSGVTGEVRLTSGPKSGSIFFNEGVLYYAVAGSVSGVKALTLIFSWQDPQWKITVRKISSSETGRFRITIKEFSRMYETWKAQWMRVSSLVPPLSLKLRANSARFIQRQDFSVHETKVLAAICEHSLVRDIMNSCSDLIDVEVAEVLVNLRKQGLIEPVRG